MFLGAASPALEARGRCQVSSPTGKPVRILGMMQILHQYRHGAESSHASSWSRPQSPDWCSVPDTHHAGSGLGPSWEPEALQIAILKGRSAF